MNNVVLVDTRKNLVHMELTPDRSVSVETGASMLALLTFLEKNGLGMYASPAPGDITVGGALAIGGHGTGIAAVGEKIPPGQAYGTLSNLIISLTAVVWDSSSKTFVLKTFKRSDADAKAFLVHFGRAFITKVTLMVGDNYNLRCVSRTNIPASELFADPKTATSLTRTFASFLDQTGRVETIMFPFTKNPWLKTWSISPKKPTFSRKVSEPFNYKFSDNIPKNVALLYESISNNLTHLNPLLGNAQLIATTTGLLATLTADIWGASKNLLLYVKPTTLRMTANGYAIITKRSNIQKVISTVLNYYNFLVNDYAKVGKYPLSGPVELRASSLDQPDVVPDGVPPSFSAVHPVQNHPEFDVAIWFDILGIPNAPYLNEAMAKIESFILSAFNKTDALVRPEWSKGWAYTNQSAWSNSTVYRNYVQASFDEWNWAVSTLNKYDPHRIFTNSFLDKFLV